MRASRLRIAGIKAACRRLKKRGFCGESERLRMNSDLLPEYLSVRALGEIVPVGMSAIEALREVEIAMRLAWLDLEKTSRAQQ
jgi:hypothetical protein